MVTDTGRMKKSPMKRDASRVVTTASEDPALTRRFAAFIAERFPLALAHADAALADAPIDPDDVVTSGAETTRVLATLAFDPAVAAAEDAGESTPFVYARHRVEDERARLTDDLTGFFAREAIARSFTPDEKRWMYRGLALTRATDNRMKQMFLSSELQYEGLGFQGKGFRSLGQEAVFAMATRLRRGDAYATSAGWTGDVTAPLIRDLGVMLAFTDDPALALNAQAAKVGPPMDGKDLHYGDLSRGVLWAAAPLTIATTTVTGIALAMKMKREDRVCFSFIGEGGSSLGEWHESINMAATMELPIVFTVENNQTALSTPVHLNTRARVFADKALGYGMPGLTVDGTDPIAIAAAYTWAAERARQGKGPVLIELVAMRMCGHAHHDDMLYLGADPVLSYELTRTPDKGYVDKERYAQWSMRDPLAAFGARLVADGTLRPDDIKQTLDDAKARVDDIMGDIIARPWPARENAGRGVTAGDDVRVHDAPAAVPLLALGDVDPDALVVEDAPPFHAKGQTYLEAVGRGVKDVLDENPRAFVIGEDVGAPYGNAFLLLKPVVDAYPDRVLNAPIAEGAILGAAAGASLEGMCPLAEMQFNDFVASGFNQLVNNAAKFRYRTGVGMPFVVRMPWGGLRRAGPYHSQDTSPWFYRTPGLKIIAPSTPHDARALLVAAARDPDPVLYYEHIALYRKPEIKQTLDVGPAAIQIGKAALRRAGRDLSLIAYGAYVWKAMAAARVLEDEDGVTCDVLDLRTLLPLDTMAIAQTVMRTGRVLLVGEDTKTGSILESIASKIGESLFEHLDGPVRVLGALDTPVPYAPSLEDEFLVSERQIIETARAMLAW